MRKRIYVSFDLEEGTDPGHDTGLTDETHQRLHEALRRIGATRIDVATRPEELG